MKTNYFLKALALIALMAFVVNVKAADFHVKNNGTDTDLAAALNQAQAGDVILIDGWVMINAVVDITKNVTIKAGVDNAGFDGGGNARLFEIHPDPVDGAKLVFEDLGFMGGNGWKSDPTDGGVARIYGGCVVEFKNCYFDSNVASRGGAFFITGDADKPTTSVTFTLCEATNNIAHGNHNESRGGYLFTDGNTYIDHEYCKISLNQSIGGRGGAFCLFGSGTRRFFYSIISDNKGGNWGTDPTDPTKLIRTDFDGSPFSGDQEMEGGVAFITGGATIFESCGIIANQSWSHAPIIRGWGDDKTTITFINSTLSKNRVVNDGRSPLWIGGNVTNTFVNSLFVENIGVNSGNGAGFDYDGGNVKLNVFNSVFTRNICSNNEGAVDIRNASNYATQLTVKNSIIGLIQGNSSVVVPIDNPNIPTKSNINLYKLENEAVQLDYAALESQRGPSGIDYDKGIRYSENFKMPYYLLIAGSMVTKLGDPALLADQETNRDLFGRVRTTAADGSITAAPTLADTPDYYDDLVGIVTPTIAPVKENIRIIGATSNGILGVDFGDLRGHAVGTLVSITGQEVEKVFDLNVVSKGYYNIHVAPGMYILKVVIGGKTYAQKLVVTK